MSKECTHSENIDLDRVFEELKQTLRQEAACKLLFAVNPYSHSRENWVCLDVGFAHQNGCQQRVAGIHSGNILDEHRRKFNTKIFMNIFSFEIACFYCNVEILDELCTQEPTNKLLAFKGKVKGLIVGLATTFLSKQSS